MNEEPLFNSVEQAVSAAHIFIRTLGHLLFSVIYWGALLALLNMAVLVCWWNGLSAADLRTALAAYNNTMLGLVGVSALGIAALAHRLMRKKWTQLYSKYMVDQLRARL